MNVGMDIDVLYMYAFVEKLDFAQAAECIAHDAVPEGNQRCLTLPQCVKRHPSMSPFS